MIEENAIEAPVRGTDMMDRYKELRLLSNDELLAEAYSVIRRVGPNTDEGVRLRAIILSFHNRLDGQS